MSEDHIQDLCRLFPSVDRSVVGAFLKDSGDVEQAVMQLSALVWSTNNKPSIDLPSPVLPVATQPTERAEISENITETLPAPQPASWGNEWRQTTTRPTNWVGMAPSHGTQSRGRRPYQPDFRSRNLTCHYCGGIGHSQQNCRIRKNRPHIPPEKDVVAEGGQSRAWYYSDVHEFAQDSNDELSVILDYADPSVVKAQSLMLEELEMEYPDADSDIIYYVFVDNNWDIIKTRSVLDVMLGAGYVHAEPKPVTIPPSPTRPGSSTPAASVISGHEKEVKMLLEVFPDLDVASIPAYLEAFSDLQEEPATQAPVREKKKSGWASLSDRFAAHAPKPDDFPPLATKTSMARCTQLLGLLSFLEPDLVQDVYEFNSGQPSGIIESLSALYPELPWGDLKLSVEMACSGAVYDAPMLPVVMPKETVTRITQSRLERVRQFCESLGSDEPDSSITFEPPPPGYDVYKWYRKTADDHKRMMNAAFRLSSRALQQGDMAKVEQCRQMATKHDYMCQQANLHASHAIFRAKNEAFDNLTEIDLHGLHVKEAIGVLARQLLIVMEMTKKNRVVRVITGAGHHSVGGVSRIKPAVIKWLQEYEFNYSMVSNGALAVRI